MIKTVTSHNYAIYNEFPVYAENKVWFQPTCTGSASDGENAGPSPRAFHVAVAIDCHMFIFGGRSGRNRYVDLFLVQSLSKL
jgi:hypothetical protein